MELITAINVNCAGKSSTFLFNFELLKEFKEEAVIVVSKRERFK